MKKNAFTLLEMIAVITLIGIILLIAIPQLGKRISDNKSDTYTAFVKLVKDAVNTYVDTEVPKGEEGNITIGELKNFGYIKSYPDGINIEELSEKSIKYSKDINGKITIDDFKLEFIESNKTYCCSVDECKSDRCS